METLTKYCDDCDREVRLTEDGYCKSCGKHADNMKTIAVNIDHTKQCRCTQCGWEGDFLLCYNGEHEPPTCYLCERSVMVLIKND
jgi:hypothetical protein